MAASTWDNLYSFKENVMQAPHMTAVRHDNPGWQVSHAELATSPFWETSKPFIKAGLSGMGAWIFVQPFDMIKVRIQLGNEPSPVSPLLIQGVILMQYPCETDQNCRLSFYDA